jgi:hypothetical protein
MSENTRTKLKNLLVEKTGSATYAFYRKIQEEMLPAKYIKGSSYDKNNAEIEIILDEINKLFTHPSGMSSKEYYNSLSEGKKNSFFSNYRSKPVLNDLRRVYDVSPPMVPRASTPPSASDRQQALLQATPPRPSRRSRKTLKRKSRKNRK